MPLAEPPPVEGVAGALRGRVAVVTGAAGGIGRAVAAVLAGHGAEVAAVDLLDATSDGGSGEPSGAPGRSLAIVADVADAESLRRAREEIHEAFGRVDLVVANAGVMFGGPFESSSEWQWSAMVDVNLSGVANTARAFVDDLLAAADAGGAADLVIIGSVASHLPMPDFSVYSATAAARAQLARSLRTELSGRGVRVKHLEPGTTITDLGYGIDDPGARERLDAMRAVTGPLEPRDIAEAVLFMTALPAYVNVAEMVVVATHQG